MGKMGGSGEGFPAGAAHGVLTAAYRLGFLSLLERGANISAVMDARNSGLGVANRTLGTPIACLFKLPCR